MSEASVTEAKSVSAASLPAESLGGPGPADPQKCSAAALEALAGAVGPGMRLTSVQLDVSSKALGPGDVSLRARLNKRTKSIAFASVEAMAGEEMVFRAQALFGLAKS